MTRTQMARKALFTLVCLGALLGTPRHVKARADLCHLSECICGGDSCECPEFSDCATEYPSFCDDFAEVCGGFVLFCDAGGSASCQAECSTEVCQFID